MTAATQAPVVAFTEVRHWQPDDCLHYETIAERGREHDWTIPAHRHQGLHQLHWLAEGAAQARIDGASHALKAPALWLLAPGAVHGFTYAKDSIGHQITVPSGALAAALAASPALAARLGHCLVIDHAAMATDAAACADLFARVADEFNHSRPGRVEALNALATLLVLLALRHTGNATAGDAQQGLRDALTHRYRSLVELHFRRAQPLGFYAEKLGVTVDHLSRVCRATTGVSALDLLHARVLEEARRELALADAPVAVIATRLGFEDPAYFTRFFTRRAGMAPTAWRVALADGRVAPPAVKAVSAFAG